MARQHKCIMVRPPIEVVLVNMKKLGLGYVNELIIYESPDLMNEIGGNGLDNYQKCRKWIFFYY